MLIEDGARTLMRAGDIAAFAAGVKNGHNLVNESDADCVFVAISGGPGVAPGAGNGEYSDIDMVFSCLGYARRDGTPYPSKRIA